MSDRTAAALPDPNEQPLIVGRSYKVSPEGDLEPTPDPTPILAGIRRTFRFLVVATVAVYLALAGVGFYAYSTSDANKQAVCNLRTDLQRRIKSSEEFVTKHPETIKQLGFTKAQVEHEIENQQRTLHALNVVTCD